jgi:ATP-dependent Clp protease ATP-binding subunit ClpE
MFKKGGFFESMTGSAGNPDEMALGDENSDNSDSPEGQDLKSKDKSKTRKEDAKKNKRKYLSIYATNLTDKARTNDIDRVIGRQREIDRVIQILNRRGKNNPVLLGEPGVGKTAIAEGLAVRIIEGKVPAKLLSAEIYLLDLTAMVAGTQFRGQFEARMKGILDEARAEANIILVIDELHSIVGAGDAEGSMNAANILKPALARGEIQILGATTLDEYRKHIEKDSALERRFQPVIIDEPSIEDAIEILKGIRGYYEDFHHVKLTDEIIEAAVNLSERYITDRFLPDKAIDVIDEAGSRANLKNEGLVELESLKKELAEVQTQKEEAISADSIEEYQKAADLKIHECRLLEKIAGIEKKALHVKITFDDIAYVIEAWTKIPVQRISEQEMEKLLHLEERLHRRLIGQDKAVEAVARAIRRNRSGFKKKKKSSSFIFVGPTGVGKTELVRTLAKELFDDENAMIRLDMSEYSEKHTVSKIIGAPPGYVGYDEAGQLTEKVRRRPYSVILLDEIEKAHPDLFHLLLQIMEDGRLTDSHGKVVNFENTILIMTSNAGTNLKANGIGFGSEGYKALESKVKTSLNEYFKPEFLNRVDEVVIFNELNNEELVQIAGLMLNEVSESVHARKMTISYDDGVKEFIAKRGFDPKMGARPMRRVVQTLIEDKLADLYIKQEIKEGDHINASLSEDGEDIELKKIDSLIKKAPRSRRKLVDGPSVK